MCIVLPYCGCGCAKTATARGAPVAVQSTRETLRAGLAEQVAQANERELALQRQQFTSADFREGIAAAAARRDPVFTGR